MNLPFERQVLHLPPRIGNSLKTLENSSSMITLTFAGDEAGDVSFNFEKGASRYFVPAFIATQQPDMLREVLADLRQELGFRETHEFKFHKMTSAEIRNRVFSTLARADFEAWGLIVDKTRLP